MARRRRTAVVVAAVAAGAATGVLLTRDAKPPARQLLGAERGSQVMPFSLERTRHRFVPLDDGGIVRVVSDDPRDERQFALVRRHLRKEARSFRRGDYTDPMRIHGHAMPGVRTLRARHREIRVRSRDVPAGPEVRFTTRKRDLVAAIHDWLRAQTMDHGAHAAP